VVPAPITASAGQAAPVPGQRSATSHAPVEGRQTSVDGRKPSAGQLALVPVQLSATSQTSAAGRQTVAAGLKTSGGQVLLVPSQISATSQVPAAARQTPVLFASAGHAALVPVQVSARSHGPEAARQTAPALPTGCWQALAAPSHWSSVQALPSELQAVPGADRVSAGHVALAPLQVSWGSHSPVEARHTVPALPAGCWQAVALPSQMSRVQTLPSSVQGVFAADRASAGHVTPEPLHASCGSHSPADARHTVPAGRRPSAGQTVLAPVQTSCASHAPAAARQTVPPLPAGCWQATFVPSH
jgi:hypothetical protein